MNSLQFYLLTIPSNSNSENTSSVFTDWYQYDHLLSTVSTNHAIYYYTQGHLSYGKIDTYALDVPITL